jgi:hypothetical protein
MEEYNIYLYNMMEKNWGIFITKELRDISYYMHQCVLTVRVWWLYEWRKKPTQESLLLHLRRALQVYNRNWGKDYLRRLASTSCLVLRCVSPWSGGWFLGDCVGAGGSRQRRMAGPETWSRETTGWRIDGRTRKGVDGLFYSLMGRLIDICFYWAKIQGMPLPTRHTL